MLRKNLKRSFIITLALLQIVFFPHPSSFAVDSGDTTPDAESVTETTTETEASSSSETETTDTNELITGPSQPTGAASDTFVYNEDTGLWENDYYTWNPKTKQTAPKPGTVDYSYNPATGKWDTTEWRYDAPSGKYVPNVVSSAVAPLSALAAGASGGTNLATNGPASPINSTNTSNSNGQYDLFYNSSISNKISSLAQSGNAGVSQNTLGGNAGTGNALDMATILNMLQSVWDPSNGEIATFSADIDGNVYGDITISPAQTPGTLSASDNKSNTNLVVNDSQDVAINNDIDLTARSGNAKVTENSEAGDAETGTANVVANVVNLLNSYIGAGQSFVGTININGDLNGDILLPPELIDQLLASNVPQATIDLNKVSNSNLVGQFNDDTSITNNVDARAASGNASVGNNSKAGDASTGSASTQVTFLNLTGRQIIGSNALLVFINVRGKWIGMIMNAPGATSAFLGGGIVKDEENENVVFNSDHETDINNNINLDAQSGDAEVSSNTKAGNAKTGNASASANIANISNSKFSLTGWFGVLFINVFGSWLGSFGVNTSAGDPPATAAVQQDMQVFGFVPNANGGFSLANVPTNGNLGTGNASNSSSSNTSTQVLGATTYQPVYKNLPATGLNPIARAYIVMAFIGLFVTAGGKIFGFIRTRRQAQVSA